MKFIHVSDLHFHSDPKDNKDACAVLASIGEKYKKHYLLVTGDIVDDGLERQYANAYDALKPFLGRIFIVPGNHDFGALGNFYDLGKAVRFDEMLSLPLGQEGGFAGDSFPVVNAVEEAGVKVMVIALDSNLETSHPFDFACGAVGQEQLEQLDRVLSSPWSADMVKFVLLHHHPFVRNDPFMELQDARQLMRMLYHRVDVVLFGHRHVWEEWHKCNGIPHILAADNAPGKSWVREITVTKAGVSVKKVSV